MNWSKTFPTRLHVNQVKTQIILRVRAVKVFVVRLRTVWIFWYPQCALRRLLLNCANALADLRFRRVHMQMCRKCCDPTQIPSLCKLWTANETKLIISMARIYMDTDIFWLNHVGCNGLLLGASFRLSCSFDTTAEAFSVLFLLRLCFACSGSWYAITEPAKIEIRRVMGTESL